jgi:hypothetical protein
VQPWETKLYGILNQWIDLLQTLKNILATLLVSNLDHTTSNDGAGQRGTEEIDVLQIGVMKVPSGPTVAQLTS